MSIAEASGDSLSGFLTRLRGLTRPTKIRISVAYDFICCVSVGLIISFLYAYLAIRHQHQIEVLQPVGAAIAGALAVSLTIAGFRGYTTVVRFMSNGSSAVFGLGTLVGTITWQLALGQASFVSISPAAIAYWLITFGLTFGSRFVLRRAEQWVKNNQQTPTPVAIYGAGSSGRQLAASLAFENRHFPTAFIDDDPSLNGLWVNGLKVYNSDHISDLIRQHKIKEVLLALPNTNRNRRREILHMLGDHMLKVQTIPSLSELLNGSARPNELRPIDVEDVLGRAPVAPDPELLRRDIEGKNVMVTGAGGSIGSELCRSIIELKPRGLVLLDTSEHALFQIDYELRSLLNGHRIEITKVHAVLGSVEDETLLRNTLQAYGIDTVFHAAAYKHVPLVEMNVVEGVRNNVMGTKVLLESISKSPVSTFVMISTDKAVRPTNVMGASKRVAELLVQSAAKRNDHCKMSIVRFGNVLGSSGSVLPLFQAQIAKGGPITVTHPEVTRFFMTIPEAAQLVIQAGALGEHGDVFHLDMGEPVRILDLARRFVRLHGLREQFEDQTGDIEIQIVGLRPGEKLYEELLIDKGAQPTQHPSIFRASERFLSEEELAPLIARIEAACEARDEDVIISLLRRLVEGFGTTFKKQAPLSLKAANLELVSSKPVATKPAANTETPPLKVLH